MKLSGKRLKVQHYPQLPCEPFEVEVQDEHEAIKTINLLADQHIWLFKNKLIPDYCNCFNVVMFDGSDWVNYWNTNESMNWEDFEAVYENETISQII